MAQPRPPVIIIGMHRSGTSLLARLLKELGLFIGHKLLPFDLYESTFFVTLNEWLLTQANASWDNTYNFQFIDEVFEHQAKKILINELKGKKRKDYLGKNRVRDIGKLEIPWGWKDPRSTITLDLWKSIFPEARVLHIYRNPIDVAASLAKREADLRASRKLTYLVRILRFLNYKATQNLSLRVTHLDEGVKLWREYVGKAFSLDEKYGNEIYHLRYEDFLEAPMKYLPEISHFAGLDPELETMKGIVKNIRADRKFAFIKDPELVNKYRTIQNETLVNELGYGEILRIFNF